jgi:hypothetical protein
MTLARESVSMLDAVGQLDAEQCYGWLFGGAPPASDAVRAVFKQREPGLQQTVVAVVSSGRSKAHAPANAQAAQRDLQEVFQTIAQTDGQAVVDTLVKLADRDAMKRDFGLACRSTATLYRRVLELEPASAANTLRFMYAAGAT